MTIKKKVTKQKEIPFYIIAENDSIGSKSLNDYDGIFENLSDAEAHILTFSSQGDRVEIYEVKLVKKVQVDLVIKEIGFDQ